ncbi:hypothetical protein [Allopontixanthobacter sediminis]|uniref:Uncharacterized protein n=1 Tax=Allopontixanthobacter sediminis TaxID=1689985 RepID=A0A845AYD6_9SPHN|nr:hypothetical protein [Allopontixanthobacter sediminis]MXP42946.1 hypothetical protein [Allopontixanthobacter sediminis]
MYNPPTNRPSGEPQPAPYNLPAGTRVVLRDEGHQWAAYPERGGPATRLEADEYESRALLTGWGWIVVNRITGGGPVTALRGPTGHGGL